MLRQRAVDLPECQRGDSAGRGRRLVHLQHPPVARGQLRIRRILRRQVRFLRCGTSGGRYVYIALMATVPGEQGKGYAETVMRRAVTEGQRGMGTTRTTLHATEMGFPLYRAMGYAEGPKFQFAGPAA